MCFFFFLILFAHSSLFCRVKSRTRIHSNMQITRERLCKWGDEGVYFGWSKYIYSRHSRDSKQTHNHPTASIVWHETEKKKENRNLTKEIIAINRLLLKLNAALDVGVRLPGESKCDQILGSINQTLYAQAHSVWVVVCALAVRRITVVCTFETNQCG